MEEIATSNTQAVASRLLPDNFHPDGAVMWSCGNCGHHEWRSK
jgi:hypothetical protein